MGEKILTPGRTIRAYCLHCNGAFPPAVATCDGTDCPFHPFRMGRGRPSVRVIRRFCLECMGGRADFVRECSTADCLCHRYRMGRNPAFRGRERNLQKADPTGDFGGKFQRSPEALTVTLPRQ